MNAKCPCDHCGGSLEFEADLFERQPPAQQTVLGKLIGQTIACPICGKPTTLFLPSVARPFNTRRPRPALWIAVAVAVIAVPIGIVLARRAETMMPGMASGEMVLALMTLGGVLFSMIVIFMWVIFPVFVYFQLKKMSLSLQSIDRKTVQEHSAKGEIDVRP